MDVVEVVVVVVPVDAASTAADGSNDVDETVRQRCLQRRPLWRRVAAAVARAQ